MVAASSPAIRGARVSSGAVRQAGLNLMKKMSMPFLFCMLQSMLAFVILLGGCVLWIVIIRLQL